MIPRSFANGVNTSAVRESAAIKNWGIVRCASSDSITPETSGFATVAGEEVRQPMVRPTSAQSCVTVRMLTCLPDGQVELRASHNTVAASGASHHHPTDRYRSLAASI
jgi:hypothetical protein